MKVSISQEGIEKYWKQTREKGISGRVVAKGNKEVFKYLLMTSFLLVPSGMLFPLVLMKSCFTTSASSAFTSSDTDTIFQEDDAGKTTVKDQPQAGANLDLKI